MSAPHEIAAIYKLVIEDVLVNIRDDFVNMGADEQVLTDLQSIWESKIIETNTLDYHKYRELFLTIHSYKPPALLPTESENDISNDLDEVSMPNELEEDDLLGSELDDSDDDQFTKTTNIIICQFDKVSRVKNKWKAQLKNIIASTMGVDLYLTKMSAEFEWK